MNVAVIGANGQLGSDISAVFSDAGCNVRPLTHADIEIESVDSVKQALTACQPEIVINTAAMHHVERCETEPLKAYAANALGPRNLAAVCNDLGAVFMHVSTDYVFDGAKKIPYVEGDLPNPLNTYGNTKLAGEHFTASISRKYFVVRTSGLYGKAPCRGKGGLNFVDLMLKLAKERPEVRVVDSEVVTPTYTLELAKQLLLLSRTDAYGVYHATAEDSCTWYAFAQEVFRITGAGVRLTVASATEFPAKVPRPHYSVLENSGLKTTKLNVFRDWRSGLASYLTGEALPS
jgi:dTDP-4-dehydrorhamnose reductase